MLQLSDFSFVLSGGATNADPLLSLGGAPSSYPIATLSLNNLFDDITAPESADNQVDYRCVYLFNDNETDTLYQFQAWILSQVPGGADVQIGFSIAVEQQQINVVGSPTGGSLSVVYNGHSFTWNSSADQTVLALALTTWFASVDPVGLPTVTPVFNGSFYNFVVTWADFRFHPLLTVSGTWEGSTVSVTRIRSGSPINSQASSISTTTTPPSFVNFTDPGSSNPISLGELRPTEGVPFWILRSVLNGADPVNLDGFTFRFSGSPTP